jgi:branched-chain amino acid transport system ATP-binding protein
MRFKDVEVIGKPAYAMAALGLPYMPDDLRIFPDLTCEENLEIARRLSKHVGYWTKERVEDLFPVLRARKKQKGLNLSGGEKKMLSLGRALMANPEMILLDEPSEGLAPLVVASLTKVMEEIRAKKMTILLADQNLKFCRQVCGRGYILEKGQIMHEGSMEDIWADEEVIKRYLVV